MKLRTFRSSEKGRYFRIRRDELNLDQRTAPGKLSEGLTARRNSGGQKISLERGTATRSKKNPGKRPHKGG